MIATIDIKKLKRKKPVFLRQDAHKIKRLKKKWRKPKGMHNKMRLGLKGHRTSPSIGYGSPKIIKGFGINGLKPILVDNLKDLEKINPKINSVIISRRLGLKKKILILEKIRHLKLNVLNIPDVDKFLENIKEKLKEKSKEKEVKEKEKEETLKEREKLAEKKIEEEKKEKPKEEVKEEEEKKEFTKELAKMELTKRKPVEKIVKEKKILQKTTAPKAK